MTTKSSAVVRRPSLIPPPGQILIAPSLLSADFSQLAGEVRRLQRAKCPWLHLDVMDGHFVPNLTFGPMVVRALRPVARQLFFDAHLMVDDPMSMADEFIDAGVQNITVHAESFPGNDAVPALRAIRSGKVRAGLSLKPKTPVSAIEDALRHADLVLVMTVEPGFGGQALIPSCLSKIRALRKLREQHGYKFAIEVDGGINAKTAELAVAAGAEVLVAGSAVFRDGRIAENVKALREAIGTK